MQDETWTDKDVAQRFEEALYTLKRLPKAVMLGYRATWPAILYTELEILQQDKKPFRLGPPLPAAIDRMEQTLIWISWLDVDDRRLVWARAKRLPWRMICGQIGVCKTTAWNRWLDALDKIVVRLNANKSGYRKQK